MTKKYVFLFLMLGMLWFQCLYFAADNGQTVDETFYNGSGYPMVRYNDYRILGEHPPLVMQLGSLPLLFFQPHYPIDSPIHLGDSGLFDVSKMGSKFLYEMGNDPYQILFWERFAVILLTLLLGVMLFLWAEELYGFGGAAVSLALYAFCPNVIAHGSLFTTDMGVAAFIFMAVYGFWRFMRFQSLRDAVLCGLACGLALMSKISAIVLFPISAALLAGYFLWPEKSCSGHNVPRSVQVGMAVLALMVFIFAAGEKMMLAIIGPICILLVQGIQMDLKGRWKYLRFAVLAAGWIGCVISAVLLIKKSGALIGLGLLGWVAVVFAGSFLLARKAERSEMRYLVFMFAFLWLVAASVIMLGYTDFPRTMLRFRPFSHYINAFKIATSHAQSVHKVCISNPVIFCDWRYFLGVMAVKTPAAVLILFAIGFISLIGSKLTKFSKLCVLAPPLLFWFVASFVNKINIGLRHVLPLYPFVFLIAGAAGYAVLKIRSKFLRVIMGALLVVGIVYNAGQSFANLPHHVSYFNEWVGGVENGAKLTADSNLNWGQDNKRLVIWMKDRAIPGIKLYGAWINAPELTRQQIPWQRMSDEETDRPGPGYYAMDLASYEALQQRSASWFRGKAADARVGKTIYVFKKD